MLRRLLFLFLPVLLLICFYKIQPQTSDLYKLGAFNLFAIFTASSFTQDTTHLPEVRLIQAAPSVSPEVQAYLVKGIEYIYKFYITKFNYAFPKDLTITIRIFSNIDDYKAYTSREASIPKTSHIGVYIHSTREIVVWRGPHTVRFIKTVFHEASHLLLRSQAHFCPSWLNEGLAEYFEEIDFKGERPVVHAQLKKDEWVKKSLLINEVPALEDYFAKTNKQWTQMDIKSNDYRTIAWSLVYYLMGSENGQQVIKDLLSYYRNQSPDQFGFVRLVNRLAMLNSPARLDPETAIVFEKNWHKWAREERQEQQIMLKPLEQDYLTDNSKWLHIQ